ncbi:CatB-related O-acetyltransferase [Rhizobium sp. G21]|uniref:CatB-related O-acetyltransferase n=1 Tax=Rhizobium sp. G21 TaxID=2758439 RepID=UPI001602F8D4|nr:CatB-related O-acetyltransferase [Rhizobium sp. G21]MBB1249819.1 CatB-related O-acetyltransferase [Rhizobium sp. G21]
MAFPDPDLIYPITLADGTVYRETMFLKNAVNHPRIEAGDYSYFSHSRPIEETASLLAPYLYPVSREKLVIGKFTQIARGAYFITSSANHPMNGVTTYPFRIFSQETIDGYSDLPTRDTIVGHDVWIGHNATIMPGVTIGHGAIIAAESVVSRDAPPYAVVGGNPARIIRLRFEPHIVDTLLDIAWWDWEIGKIERHLTALEAGDIAALSAAD